MRLTHTCLKYLVVVSALISINACEKKATDYRSFLNGQEKVYPGVVADVQVNPGDNRILLTWKPNTDPNVTNYIVYWNNGADSVVIDATSHNTADTIKTYIPDLDEASHTFVVYSLYAKGEKSIPTNIENAKVYGDRYRASLLNRPVSAISYVDSIVKITWNIPDTINIVTKVQYIDTLDQLRTLNLQPDSNTLVLSDWKLPTKIYYRSAYIPQINAIDTFEVNTIDSLIVQP